MLVRHPVRWLRDHPMAADALLALLLTTISVTMHWTMSDDVSDAADPSWWGTLLVIAAVAPIAWRRTHPIPVVIVVVVAQCINEVATVQGTGWVGVLVAVYSVGAHTTGRPRTRTVAAVGVVVAGLLGIGVAIGQIGLGSVISTVVTLVTAVVVGDNLQRRRQHVHDLAERAERAERERDLLAQQRVAEERTRIARELHDAVAHSVSVMIIQAGAARRRLAQDPDAAAAALATIETTGREAMTELRRILGVLRHADPADLAPQPSIGRLAELATSDMPVQIHASEDLSGVPAAVEMAVFRIVQEALTNVRRHAGRVTHVDVTIDHRDERLVVEVTDDGRGAAADAATDGFGLVGMRERAAACGGTLVAGPRPGGGWRVHAELPIAEGTRSPDRVIDGAAGPGARSAIDTADAAAPA